MSRIKRYRRPPQNKRSWKGAWKPGRGRAADAKRAYFRSLRKKPKPRTVQDDLILFAKWLLAAIITIIVLVTL